MDLTNNISPTSLGHHKTLVETYRDVSMQNRTYKSGLQRLRVIGAFAPDVLNASALLAAFAHAGSI
jgi:hypothetical protein